MIKKIYTAALAALTLAACAPEYDTDNLPIEILPEPEIVYEGSGKLVTVNDDDEEVETNSLYSWKADGDAINFTFTVDLDEYADNGGWEVGHFTLDATSICSFLGVESLPEEVYPYMQAYDPDGTAVDWTSYAPGMWVDDEGVGCSYSLGYAYWQWYICADSTHDYDYDTHKSLFVLGGNPSNTVKIAGSTIVSKSKITLGDRVVDFIVTIKYTGETYEEPTEPEGPSDYLECGNDYAYSAAAQGNHQYTWVMNEDGIVVDVDAHIPSIEDWGYLFMTIDPAVMTEYLGIDDINQLADLEYFYPVDAEGNKLEKWTSYAPGEWVDADGVASDYSTGALFWQYQFGDDNKYEGHYTEGLLVIGTNPGNIEDLDGKTVTSKAVLGEKSFTVNVHYHAELPTSGAGTIGANSYSWELKEGAFNVVANVSASHLDDSWGLLGFPINAAYVNDFFGIDVNSLTIDDFYPVDSEGNQLEKWSSYAPGQWFTKTGDAGAWDTGIAFWQWYNADTYDYDLNNLFYVGKNPSTAIGETDDDGNLVEESADKYVAGQTYVSKAKLAGNDFTFTLNIVE